MRAISENEKAIFDLIAGDCRSMFLVNGLFDGEEAAYITYIAPKEDGNYALIPLALIVNSTILANLKGPEASLPEDLCPEDVCPEIEVVWEDVSTSKEGIQPPKSLCCSI